MASTGGVNTTITYLPFGLTLDEGALPLPSYNEYGNVNTA